MDVSDIGGRPRIVTSYAADGGWETRMAYADQYRQDGHIAERDRRQRVVSRFCRERGGEGWLGEEQSGSGHNGHVAHRHDSHGPHTHCTCGLVVGIYFPGAIVLRDVVAVPAFEGRCPICRDWPAESAGDRGEDATQERQ